MDTTHSPHLEEPIQTDLKELMSLTAEERRDLILLAAGMNIAKALTAKEE